MNYELHQGDNMVSLKLLEDNSVDSIVTDPPYGLSFMNKKWDYDVPTTDFWKEALRVLKPGGHVISFSSARTYHRMAVALEDAGFEIRDQLMWVYGSGFPKSHNIGKAYDKKMGNEREVIGTRKLDIGMQSGSMHAGRPVEIVDADVTKGSSPYEGWGTALKPAHEPMVLARKPISEKTVTDNVIRWGVGGINIDGCRIGEEEFDTSKNRRKQSSIDNALYKGGWKGVEGGEIVVGRFPANFILQDEDQEFSKYFYIPKVSKKERNRGMSAATPVLPGTDKAAKERRIAETGNAGNHNNHLFEQAQAQAKAEGKLMNTHPTVKPVDLMRYLVRLVTPTGGTVLDPYNGSGATGIASVLEDFNYIGMEFEQDYVDVSKARIENAIENPEEWN